MNLVFVYYHASRLRYVLSPSEREAATSDSRAKGLVIIALLRANRDGWHTYIY